MDAFLSKRLMMSVATAALGFGCATTSVVAPMDAPTTRPTRFGRLAVRVDVPELAARKDLETRFVEAFSSREIYALEALEVAPHEGDPSLDQLRQALLDQRVEAVLIFAPGGPGVRSEVKLVEVRSGEVAWRSSVPSAGRASVAFKIVDQLNDAELLIPGMGRPVGLKMREGPIAAVEGQTSDAVESAEVEPDCMVDLSEAHPEMSQAFADAVCKCVAGSQAKSWNSEQGGHCIAELSAAFAAGRPELQAQRADAAAK